jgi:deoxyribose-phosphate aldolase
MKLNRYMDHAVLKPEMTQEEAKAAILDGIKHEVATVCVRPCDIELAKSLCEGTKTTVSCVLDFPHGTGGAKAKAALAALYAQTGVTDIDMVMNYGLARSGEWERVEEEIRGVVEAAHKHNVIVKVIFETSVLTIDEIKRATEASITAGADFVKTSTGFLGEGATVDGVKAMIETSKGRIKVKASGGIRNLEAAQKFVDMGVERLGVGYSSTSEIFK